MSRSIRLFFKQVNGVVRANFNWPPINMHSAVLITAAEISSNSQFFGSFRGDPAAALANLRPNLGAAGIWVSNVGAHGDGQEAGGVEFLLHVDWGSPLDVMVTITVLDDIEDYVGVS